jgi:sodium-independent sulfate anion transporter 11
MLSFWLTLFVSSEVGIGTAVGFNIAHYLLVLAFTRVRRRPELQKDTQNAADSNSNETTYTIPLDTQYFKFHQDILFMNAYNVKGQCWDIVQTYNSGIAAPLSRRDPDR